MSLEEIYEVHIRSIHTQCFHGPDADTDTELDSMIIFSRGGHHVERMNGVLRKVSISRLGDQKGNEPLTDVSSQHKRDWKHAKEQNIEKHQDKPLKKPRVST